MTKRKSDLVCFCGHLESVHGWHNELEYGCCEECGVMSVYRCEDCGMDNIHDFKADNLKMIERKYNLKKKGKHETKDL